MTDPVSWGLVSLIWKMTLIVITVSQNSQWELSKGESFSCDLGQQAHSLARGHGGDPSPTRSLKDSLLLPHSLPLMTAQCPAHPRVHSTHESFLCCSFYFNLKQMVAHRCEQLWPLEHKEQALALNVPLPPHTGRFIPLVPSSPAVLPGLSTSSCSLIC